MSIRRFFDTNVLVYTDDKSAPSKQRRALELLAEHHDAGTGVLSLQVLQEYFVTVTRKLQVDAQIARRKVELLACRLELDVAASDLSDILAAIDIACTAFPSGMRWFCAPPAKVAARSEDFQNEGEIDGLQIVNPFI